MLGASRRVKDDVARKKLKAWIRASSIERPLITKSMAELKEIAADRLGDDIKISGSKVDDYRRNLVSKLLDEVDAMYDSSCLEHDLMVKMLGNSFLKSQRKGNEEGMSKYTLAGQRAELQIMRGFFKSYSNSSNRDGFALYRPGLVENNDDPCVKTSADGLLVGPWSSDGNFINVPIEVKSRV